MMDDYNSDLRTDIKYLVTMFLAQQKERGMLLCEIEPSGEFSMEMSPGALDAELEAFLCQPVPDEKLTEIRLAGMPTAG
jgi:hypothetical protein